MALSESPNITVKELKDGTVKTVQQVEAFAE